MILAWLANKNLRDIYWQYPALGRPLVLENRKVFFNKLVKKGFLLSMAPMVRRIFAQAGLLASRHLQHNRILAMRCLRVYWVASNGSATNQAGDITQASETTETGR